ncbi:hypothetical protein V8C35DRAFT_326373 [Trichoderma chlorosporum]
MCTKSGVAEAFLGGPEWTSSITEEEVHRRMDLTILPTAKKWKDTLQQFQRLLADDDMTIGQILSNYFTPHEARLFILSESAILKPIQEDNALRFHKLLQTRFQGVTSDAPTKLTMLYFGLPIEPVDFSLAEMTHEMESRKPEPPRYAVEAPQVFSSTVNILPADVCPGKEDPSYPVPVELPQSWLSNASNTFLKEQPFPRQQAVYTEDPDVRMRGGGADDDSDWGEAANDDWSGQNDDDFALSDTAGVDDYEGSAVEEEEASEHQDSAQETVEEAIQEVIQEPTKETSQEPVVTGPSGVEAIRTLLKEKEPMKATYADQAETQRPRKDVPSDSDVRRKAWAQQPSIFNDDGLRPWPTDTGIQFPMNAPPVEHMLRTGPRMPGITKSVLTPTEQEQLQRTVWDLRSICLNRTTTGSRGDCCAPGQQDTEMHPKSSNVARVCIFCHEEIPGHRNAEDIRLHLKEKHRNELLKALGVTKAAIRRFDGGEIIAIPLKRAKRCHRPSPTTLAPGDMSVDEPKSQEHQLDKAAGLDDRCGHDENYQSACHEENLIAMPMVQPSDSAAYNQQESNLQLQVAETSPDIIGSDEEQSLDNEAILNTTKSEQGGQDLEMVDVDDSSDDQGQPKSTKGPNTEGHREETAEFPADNLATALQSELERAGAELGTSLTEDLDPNVRRHDQQALHAVLLRNISNSPFDELNAAPPSVAQSRPPSRPTSPDSQDRLTGQGAKEDEAIQSKDKIMANSPELEDPESSESEPDNDSDFESEQDRVLSDDEESEDGLQGDASRSKGRKRGGKKRGKTGDRNYQFSDDEDDDDDEESGADEDGKRVSLPRRPSSPNWQKVLGPDDPQFIPTDEFYCSKCFRKAPKKHNRDKSPLGRTREIELHYDDGRCCGIRRGIGSTKRLPNRSGWIPSADMPKPLGNLRKQFLRRYPAYARTVYPLSASNANGSYYRSDPNNDDNKGWWDIPWPPFRGPAPLPNGWEAPDVANAAIAGKARKQFKLRAEGDSLYVQEKNVQYSDDEDIESDKDVNGKRKRKSRPSSAVNSRHATPAPAPAKRPQKTVAKAATPRLAKKKETILNKALKGKAVTPRKAPRKNAERKTPTRRSTRKRQKTD